MTPKLSEKLAAAVDGMPAFPQSVQKILELTRHVECSSKDLVQVIEKDPVVTVKVLRVVNAAYYSLPKQITSINHAVVYLGFNTIKNLSLSIAAIGIMPTSNEAGFDGRQCLLHSLSTAGIAKQLALRLGSVDPMDCFVAGLLHDFGKMLLAQFMPGPFRDALALSQENATSLHAALREVIGVDHAEVAAMLAERWRFPADLIEAIRFQSGPELADKPMIACVFAANQISKKLKFGFGGNPWVEELPPAIAQRLGGRLDQVIAALGDLAPVFEEAKVFSRI
ncbi:MAG: HDOD domain-containing protein [Rhodoferax sp.]|uniref:HDOD domain-containing protein n=1 Tax=Rhodoferax sp. TaxID=50421 RepID=UPI002626E183|nr:HDOD domain-containing protein [Rhodoferax sp.]MDD5336101.1 HDOD domain-containing protein [Rhodoferax sp.]